MRNFKNLHLIETKFPLNFISPISLASFISLQSSKNIRFISTIVPSKCWLQRKCCVQLSTSSVYSNRIFWDLILINFQGLPSSPQIAAVTEGWLVGFFFPTKVTLDMYSTGCEARVEKVSEAYLCTDLWAAAFRRCRAIPCLPQDLVWDALVSRNCSQQRSLVSSTTSARASRSGQVSEFQHTAAFLTSLPTDLFPASFGCEVVLVGWYYTDESLS